MEQSTTGQLQVLLVYWHCTNVYNQQECITKSKIKKNYRGKKDKNNKNLIA